MAGDTEPTGRDLLDRAVLGIALLVGPEVAFRILAALTLLGAVALPVMGPARLEALVDWGSRLPDWRIRLWCAVVVAFGAFLLWSSVLGWRAA